MAGRIRTIKPELLEDDKTAALTHEGWRCFVSLILLADDYGNFRAHPALLDGAIFWGRGSTAGVGRLLRELAETGLVDLYSVRDQTYGHVRGWARHQRVDKPGKPRCPGPKEAENLLQFENSGIFPESFLTDLRPPTSDLDPDHRPPTTRGGGAPRLPPSPPIQIQTQKHRAHRMPKDWKPSDHVLADLREKLGVDPMQCWESFSDWASSSPKAVKLDWDATFRTWVRREAKEGKLDPLPPDRSSQLGIDPNDKSGPASEESKKILREALARLNKRIDDDNARLFPTEPRKY